MLEVLFNSTKRLRSRIRDQCKMVLRLPVVKRVHGCKFECTSLAHRRVSLTASTPSIWPFSPGRFDCAQLQMTNGQAVLVSATEKVLSIQGNYFGVRDLSFIDKLV
jgi:hypothetical protein